MRYGMVGFVCRIPANNEEIQMVDAEQTPVEEELNPFEEYLAFSRSELERIRRESKEIEMLVEQSQGEVEKLAQRNATVSARIHQMQTNFDTLPREDIRETYEAAQDAQQRLFTMRGQLEKLESDQKNMQRYADFLSRTLQILEGRTEDDLLDGENGDSSTMIEKIIDAQEEERRKISRHIHDGPAQALSNFILQSEIALRLFDSDLDQAREEMMNLKTAASSTFSQVRDFIFDLRPMMLDDLGLVPTIRRYLEAYKEKTGLELNLVITGTERRFESHREVLTFRSIQSMLSNVREHAQATQVKVNIDLDENQIRAVVEDNGRGFEAEELFADDSIESSLITIRDRVDQIGGEFDIDTAPGEGTRITFSIPTA
jgi:two-component system sensor histidine kinase DegS